MVYVQNKDGKPLMPTKRHGKVKHLLRAGKAKVVQRTPFTIRLTYECPNGVQEVTLGIDAGSKTVGVSATTDSGEVYSAEVALRTDVVELISTRRQFRRARRSRTKRYRKPRFDNRKKKEGWLSPSVQQKIGTHLKIVEQVHKILPISKIIVETASFDIQKIKNPDIQGSQYQEGEQLDAWNVREYVIWRDGHTCQSCKGKSGDKILETHHIESRKVGGDAPNNLVTLCGTCHGKVTRGQIELGVKRGQPFREQAFMGIMRWAFYDRLKGAYPDVSMTYGHITKNARIKAGLEKTHRADARCITGRPSAEPLDVWYRQKAKRRHNRQTHKATVNKGGTRKLNQSPRYVHGYQLYDKVLYGKQECFVFGRRASGSFDVRLLDGTKLSAGVSHKKLKRIGSRRSILTERRIAVSSPLLKHGVSTAEIW